MSAVITTWPNLIDTNGKTVETETWDPLLDRLIAAGEKPFRGKNEHPGWSPTRMDPLRRENANVRTLTALVIDYDGTATLRTGLEVWSVFYGLIHTTRRHTPEVNRFRVILPLAREVTPAEHTVLWRHVVDLSGHAVDEGTKDASRFWYLPGVEKGGEFIAERLHGYLMDPDPLLRDAAEWAASKKVPPSNVTPLYPGETREVRYAANAFADECNKVGMAGPGARNNTLFHAAATAGNFIVTGLLGENEAWSRLQQAAQICGLPPFEARRTIQSGVARGKLSPRQVPEPTRSYSASPPPPAGAPWPPQDEPSPATEGTAPPAAPAALGEHPAAIALRWLDEGPLVRVSTGIEALDALCLGGFPVPWRVMLIGAPSAGKTFVGISVADRMAREAATQGLCVGILAVDEEPEDITVRLLQLRGFSIESAEKREPAVVVEMAKALEPLRVRLYSAVHTIEAATADLAAWAKSEGRRAALFIDSVQAVSSDLAQGARSPRELVEANIRALRMAHDVHKMLVVATVEANRQSYRDEDAAETSNDMAAGAESRAIEYGAKTQLMLRTPKGHPDVIWCRVVKNRRAHKGEFFLSMDRASHGIAACEDPRTGAGGGSGESTDQLRGRAQIARLEADARQLLALLVKTPGLGSKRLRSEVKEAGWGWGIERIEGARARLEKGIDGYRIVDRGERNGERRWFAEPIGGPA